MIIIKEKYKKEVVGAMKKEFGYKNDLAVPCIKKVVLNIGTGAALKDKKILDLIKENLRMISGQEPILRKAKKSIAGFKIREGLIVGMKVTLRRQRMFDFLDKFVNIVLPRVRDFNGISFSSIDQQGNLNIGIKEHNVFLEVDPNKVQHIHGLEIAVVTNAKSRAEGQRLFILLGFPMQKLDNKDATIQKHKHINK